MRYTERSWCARCCRPMVPDTRTEPVPDGHCVHCGRGLCKPCYKHLQGTNPDALLDYPRMYPSTRDFIEDYMIVWESGIREDRNIAARLGMKLDTMQTKRRRANKAGHHLPMIVTPQTIYV